MVLSRPDVARFVAVIVAASAAAFVVGRSAGWSHGRGGGLRNMGESRCYVNAVLQALAATPTFLSSLTATRLGPLAETLSMLAEIVNRAGSVTAASTLADRVLAEFSLLSEQFGSGQQDAHEFLVRLLEALQVERVSSRCGISLSASSIISTAPRSRFPALRPVTGCIQRPTTIEVPTRGLTSSCVVCLSCSHSSIEQIGEFRCVTCVLPLAGGVLSVGDCIAEHFRPQVIDGYACDMCSRRRLASSGSACKITRAPRLPPVFIVHFSRLATPGYRNETFVRLEKTIDLAPHASADWGNGPAISELYTLTAVVCHLGSAFGGHYVCYRRHSHEVDQWLLCSDEKVIGVPFSAVQVAGGAYLAFYERNEIV